MGMIVISSLKKKIGNTVIATIKLTTMASVGYLLVNFIIMPNLLIIGIIMWSTVAIMLTVLLAIVIHESLVKQRSSIET